ncbi:MAG: nitrilase family protein [Planctomycetota bacterium]|jgi:predicted amidohydrolase|nr:nitrilase family protein [Planctomycetota bacterium]
MRDIRIATAQFENRDNDNAYNLSRVETLTRIAVEQDAEIVSFHEGCIPGYTWIQPLSKEELLEIAEPVPDGDSVSELMRISKQYGIVVMAGLVERDAEDNVYNTYVAVSGDEFVARHRKLHPFVNPHLSPGQGYTVFDLLGCRMGMLICYDNNLVENPRITAMMGAEIIFMPHVTCCLPSAMPGRGIVPKEFWDNRHRDPVSLQQEFLGPKGRGWLMRWLPARAYENGIYAVFSNPVGWDYDTVKPGLAMVLDPYGEVIAESHALEDDVVVGLCTPEKIANSSGQRYLKARRPDLYGAMVEPQESVTLPGWKMEHETDDRDAETE